MKTFRSLLIFLFLTANIILSSLVLVNLHQQQEEKMNTQICIQEGIPTLEPITEEF